MHLTRCSALCLAACLAQSDVSTLEPPTNNTLFASRQIDAPSSLENTIQAFGFFSSSSSDVATSPPPILNRYNGIFGPYPFEGFMLFDEQVNRALFMCFEKWCGGKMTINFVIEKWWSRTRERFFYSFDIGRTCSSSKARKHVNHAYSAGCQQGIQGVKHIDKDKYFETLEHLYVMKMSFQYDAGARNDTLAAECVQHVFYVRPDALYAGNLTQQYLECDVKQAPNTATSRLITGFRGSYEYIGAVSGNITQMEQCFHDAFVNETTFPLTLYYTIIDNHNMYHFARTFLPIQNEQETHHMLYRCTANNTVNREMVGLFWSRTHELFSSAAYVVDFTVTLDNRGPGWSVVAPCIKAQFPEYSVMEHVLNPKLEATCLTRDEAVVNSYSFVKITPQAASEYGIIEIDAHIRQMAELYYKKEAKFCPLQMGYIIQGSGSAYYYANVSYRFRFCPYICTNVISNGSYCKHVGWYAASKIRGGTLGLVYVASCSPFSTSWIDQVAEVLEQHRLVKPYSMLDPLPAFPIKKKKTEYDNEQKVNQHVWLLPVLSAGGLALLVLAICAVAYYIRYRKMAAAYKATWMPSEKTEKPAPERRHDPDSSLLGIPSIVSDVPNDG